MTPRDPGSSAARSSGTMTHITSMKLQWIAWITALVLLACPACTPDRSAPAPEASAPAPEASASAPASSAPTLAPPPKAATAVLPLKVGVTLHPYFSWTKNVVGDAPGVEVRPILPGEVDAGNYQPRPEDIAKLADLDAIVINGIGHDDFIEPMIKASGNTRITIIRPNEATPLLKSAHGGAVNSHTFLSFTNAVQQTYAIERALAALRPEYAALFHANATAYATRLRKLEAAAAERLAHPRVSRVVTVHDGYSYLCQELGIEVAGVVEPSHGLVPSAAELGQMVDLLKREKITVVLSEESFPDKLLAVLRAVPGVKVYVITHIAAGAYSAGEFEREMSKNADTLVAALAGPPAPATAPR
jgi:zinc transport system substrate-binding protein